MQSVMEYSSTTENTNTNGEPYTHHGSSEVVHEYGLHRRDKEVHENYLHGSDKVVLNQNMETQLYKII